MPLNVHKAEIPLPQLVPSHLVEKLFESVAVGCTNKEINILKHKDFISLGQENRNQPNHWWIVHWIVHWIGTEVQNKDQSGYEQLKNHMDWMNNHRSTK